MHELIHIDKKTPLTKLQDFLGLEGGDISFDTVVFNIFAHYNLHNTLTGSSSLTDRAMMLMSDLEDHGINYKIGRELQC